MLKSLKFAILVASILEILTSYKTLVIASVLVSVLLVGLCYKMEILSANNDTIIILKAEDNNRFNQTFAQYNEMIRQAEDLQIKAKMLIDLEFRGICSEYGKSYTKVTLDKDKNNPNQWVLRTLTEQELKQLQAGKQGQNSNDKSSK